MRRMCRARAETDTCFSTDVEETYYGQLTWPAAMHVPVELWFAACRHQPKPACSDPLVSGRVVKPECCWLNNVQGLIATIWRAHKHLQAVGLNFPSQPMKGPITDTELE